MKDGATEKAARMRELEALVKTEAPLENYIALAEYQIGLSREKAESYLRVLHIAGRIDIEEISGIEVVKPRPESKGRVSK